MSLLNDVLRDLDQRLPAKRSAKPDASGAAPKASRPWLPLAAAVAVAYYVTVEMLGIGQTPPTPAPEAIAANAAINPKWLAQLPKAQAALAARVAVEPVRLAPAATGAGAADDLAARGLKALADGHYLPPGPVNALHLLQTARALAPEHAAALAGLEQLGLRLTEQAEAAIAAGDIARARDLLTVMEREHLAPGAQPALAAALVRTASAPPAPETNSRTAAPRAPAVPAQVAAPPSAPDWRRMQTLAETGDASGLDALAARLTPPLAALARGQAAFLRGDHAGARAQLEQVSLTGEAEWLRLRWLASFCWAAADYGCARDQYARASHNPSVSGADWLGLAASADQLGRAAEARAAYVRARAAGGHSFDVQRYIEARLAALSEAAP